MSVPTLLYARCPRCARTVPAHLGERFCVNDGAPLVTACPACTWPVTSPYARYCPGCGAPYGHPVGAARAPLDSG